jgi:hypothetical protein
MKIGTVCRDEGAGEVCMRGTVATQALRVRAHLLDVRSRLSQAPALVADLIAQRHLSKMLPSPQRSSSLADKHLLFSCTAAGAADRQAAAWHLCGAARGTP